jgi:uncharacterized protein (DUF427 family)
MAVELTPAVDPPVLRWERSPRRVRAELGGDTVARSARAIYVWEAGQRLPEYAVPLEDVAAGVLVPAHGEAPAHGDAAETYDVAAGGRTAEHAAWTYRDPDLAGYVVLAFKALDRWFEETEEVFVHPRDPHHRVDALPSERRIRIVVDGEQLAESSDVVTLFETGLPTRYYLPAADVRQDALRPSETHTRCPYKGVASYHDVVTAHGEHPDLVWYYPEPIAAVENIRDRLCFYNEKVSVYVDDELEERPQTKFS